MRKLATYLSVLLLLVATPAWSGGVNFFWNDCPGNGGVGNQNFACDTNNGIHVAAGSFILSHPMPDFGAVQFVINLGTNDLVLPSWWQFLPASTHCRDAALSLQFDFSAFANANQACQDPFQTAAQGGLANEVIQGDHARITAYGVIDPALAQPLADGVEYYAFRLVLSNAKTTGLGSCTGCTSTAALVLNGIQAYGVAPSSSEFNDAPAQSSCITWQGDNGPCAATPARNTTWGQVKSLYR